MSAAQTKIRLVTPEELYGPEFAHLKRTELWDGELIEMSPSSGDHGSVVTEIIVLIRQHLGRDRNLRVGPESIGFLLREDPPLLLSPDVSVYRRSGRPPWIAGAPIVAVEVLSPSNSRSEMTKKRQWYLKYGAEQVWIVDPRRKTLEVYFADGRGMTITAGAVTCEGVLDGLAFPLAEIFEDDLEE